MRPGLCSRITDFFIVQIGVVPTDSYPALICDLQNANAAELLAAVKDISPTKPMSILVKDFAAIDEYTNGWPAPGAPGELLSFSVGKLGYSDRIEEAQGAGWMAKSRHLCFESFFPTGPEHGE
jgi:hypothetical protein